MSHVLIVHDSETIRGDLSRALLAEGCTVAEADSSAAAVREIWAGNFAAALIGNNMPNVGGVSLEEHLHNLAPELVTMKIGKEPAVKIARKLVELLDGGAVAA
jgi:DNA-binding NtrC family response regulator